MAAGLIFIESINCRVRTVLPWTLKMFQNVYMKRGKYCCVFLFQQPCNHSLSLFKILLFFFATSLISPECPSWKPKPYIFCKHNKRDSYLLLGAISKLCKRK